MDIDTAPPSASLDTRPSMQLDGNPDETMMDVDPAVPPLPTSPSNPQDAPSIVPNTCVTSNPPFVPFWHQSSPRGLDCANVFAHYTSAPPVAIITSSNLSPLPKLKLDQLFVEWFARSESQAWLRNLLDDPNAGKPQDSSQVDFSPRSSLVDRSLSPGRNRSLGSPQPNTNVISQPAPGSPVSKLFWTHEPFGDSDSPYSPPSAPSGTSPQRPGFLAQGVSTMDLGQSGTLVPLPIENASTSCETSPSAACGQGSTNLIGAQPLDLPANVSSSDSQLTPISTNAPHSCSSLSMAPQKTDSVLSTTLDILNAVKDSRPSFHVPHSDEPKHPETHSNTDELNHVDTEVNPAKLQDTYQELTATKDSLSSNVSNELINSNYFPKQHTSNSSERMNENQNSVHGSLVDNGCLSNINDDSSMTSGADVDFEASGPGAPNGAKFDRTDVPYVLQFKSIPEFYFPRGKDSEQRERKEREAMKNYFKAQCARHNKSGLSRNELAELVVEVIGLPSFFSSIIFNLVMELCPSASVNASSIADFSESNTQCDAEVMRDVEGEEMSSSSSVSGVRRMPQSGSDAQNSVDTAMDDPGRVKGVENSLTNAKDPSVVTQGTAEGGPTSNGADTNDLLTEAQMTMFYNLRCAGQARESRLFYTLLGSNTDRNYLISSDFRPLMRALLMSHQGLAFLHVTPEFQQRYSETVIERIYFGCTRQHNGRLTLADLKRSKLLDTLMVVDEEEDINRERRFFSYEHFYVLYCRFWELDANHDLQIDKEDLLRYGSHSLTTRIVERIFSGHARPLDAPENGGYMSYTDFIWFCLSEEDKTSDTAIDYWFRCIDLDGDGLITMFDMEYFYREQLHRMESFGHEPVQIKDILCQLLDMINPNMNPPVIRRRDLKRCRLAGNFFNVLFNLNKFFAIEARDPLQIRQEHATPELTDWDRFAALEYLRLSADEDGEEEESWEEVGEATNPLMSGEAPF